MTAVAELLDRSELQRSEALAHSLRRRDRDALDRLIEEYQYRLYRYLLYLTRNKAAAEDCFQETWIRVLERGHQYNGRSRFQTWLFAIARNLVIDRVRRRKKIVSLDALFDWNAGDEPEPAADAVSQLEQLERREGEERLSVHLDRLSAVHREALLLRFQEELSLEEIASVVEAPLSTVKSRIYRGMDLLRESIGSEEP
jgi:RNA polymerase sigma-70 factor (ECF subfamily)